MGKRGAGDGEGAGGFAEARGARGAALRAAVRLLPRIRRRVQLGRRTEVVRRGERSGGGADDVQGPGG